MSHSLQLPVEPYRLTPQGRRFGEKVSRKIVLWAVHLGDDIVLPPGHLVKAAGAGEVVLARIFPGSEVHRSWGGLIVLAHQHKKPQASMTNDQNGVFYTLYGHLANLQVNQGDTVVGGQGLGEVAPGPTAENGWWSTAHVHFAVYTGPWKDGALPGYWRPEQFWRTKLSWWHNPQNFIEEYNRAE
jgi:murein DD-endopeptidase MepM/ murein hydrolase activator NlpD